MKRLILASIAVLAFVVCPSVALSKPVTHQHVSEYTKLYREVASKFGHRTPGRNIVKNGTPHGAATDAQVVMSISRFDRWLAPPPQPVTTTYTTTPASTTATSSYTTSYTTPTGLEACIIRAESGGNPQATNGQYKGIGQWSPSSWQEYSHGQYGSSPLDASYAQQQQVLASEGTAGMISQQGQYDGCG